MIQNNFKQDAGIYFAEYMLENKSTIRAAAQYFGVSKTKILNHINKLEKDNYILYVKARTLLDYNKSQRALRGGNTTRERYKGVSKSG